MSDHVRKYDWQFEMPQKSLQKEHSSVIVEALPVVPTMQPVAENLSVQQSASVGKTSTAPVDFNTVQDINPNESEYKPTNPFDNETSNVNSDTDVTKVDNPESTIDPETGLEVPDYMKAFM